MVGGTNFAGQFEVVVLNRGTRQGIEPGNVLAIDQAGDVVRDLYRNGRQLGESSTATSFAKKVQLPEERIGTLLIFKVYERVSYALILGATDSVFKGDYVHNP